ncbi:hypothetical protein PFICI_02536 [Pestalotiopsis fici W106-1]|uniref:Heterokaryon incompatibility domain-containing protein n=1 Tax=Pestalotiopsis fici (strain W106-1 / CGMCC3.15140) TaxID=1229662 RepID=W3XH07_PESFW|nr:uncharacterized protein PFICI_02536 [Pestalotiopsis fici W106-1]ETS84511.1 hypothetical protein PFICI_02536 [Pestalotiopsis fici W106-1]
MIVLIYESPRDKDYAILSHRWLPKEYRFEDIQNSTGIQSPLHESFAKVKKSCDEALRGGFDYLWIDTCCIDQSSSAELSESINSMFLWYRQARECYVYLDDFALSNYAPISMQTLGTSQWFRRGWTLQELVAPSELIFFDCNWKRIGTRDDPALSSMLHTITGIPVSILSRISIEKCHAQTRYQGHSFADGTCELCGTTDQLPMLLKSRSVAERISWASRRQTTRAEDESYCLLGLFDVNMPLLYGEGRQKAFLRLQEGIVKASDDQSILAYSVPHGEAANIPQLLANSPQCYQVSYDTTEAKFMHVNLLLNPPRPFLDVQIGDLFTTPSLRIKIKEPLKLRHCMTYPSCSSVPAGATYFPAGHWETGGLKQRNTGRNILCGAICFIALDETAAFVVLWGFHGSDVVTSSRDIHSESSGQRPWCRVLSWQDIIDIDLKWYSTTAEAKIMAQLKKRVTTLSYAYDGDRTPELTDPKEIELRGRVDKWSRQEERSKAIWGTGVTTTVYVSIDAKLFLGRSLYRLRISTKPRE